MIKGRDSIHYQSLSLLATIIHPCLTVNCNHESSPSANLVSIIIIYFKTPGYLTYYQPLLIITLWLKMIISHYHP